MSWLGGHRPQRGGQLGQVPDIREVGGRKLAPGDPVADCPPVGSPVKERGPRNPAQGRVEALTDGNNLCPAARFMLAAHIFGGAPPIDAQRTADSQPGPGEPETLPGNLSKDLGLPRQLVVVKLGWLQDHITGDPGCALPAAQRDRAGAGDAEGGEDIRRWLTRHR